MNILPRDTILLLDFDIGVFIFFLLLNVIRQIYYIEWNICIICPLSISSINVTENRRGNQEWTTQRH
jgi:hypothetical protein